MTPAEAGAVQLEEPNWCERFAELCARYAYANPRWTIELCEHDAYEKLLEDYRRYHFTWLEDGMREPMDSKLAQAALVPMGILPPRSRMKNLERGGKCFEEQFDNHCWLQIAGRAWRIMAVESKVMFLESFGEDLQLDTSRVKWDNYIKKAVTTMQAAWGL